MVAIRGRREVKLKFIHTISKHGEKKRPCKPQRKFDDNIKRSQSWIHAAAAETRGVPFYCFVKEFARSSYGRRNL
jgi:hypothetical protein